VIFALSVGAFVVVLMLAWGAFDLFNLVAYGDQTQAKKRMTADPHGASADSVVDIVRRDMFDDSEEGSIEDLLNRFTPLPALRHLLKNADSDMPVAVFVMFSLALAAVGFGGALYLRTGWMTTVAMTGGAGALPYMYQQRAKKKRLKAIEAQLPDALDLIARTLQAGHAFIMGLKMAADQVEDPLSREFQMTFEQINFGVSVQEAMSDLSQRIDSLDIKFFVTSLLVQLETGGNLAEIIGSISTLIRSRFELLGKVQALSAEGRISSLVMFSLPIVLGVALYFINPDYMALLFTDPLGKTMLGGGAMMMCLGMAVTRRMIQIRI
jgi:tight adherence protein B